jgi:hypothetical protein
MARAPGCAQVVSALAITRARVRLKGGQAPGVDSV